jgi:hypothetical protein
MFAQKTVALTRASALATVAALALTAVAPSAAIAAPRGKAAVTTGATDISARRRLNGGAAAAAAFAGVVGTGLAIAAAQDRHAYYDDNYGGGPYGGGPVYAVPAPGYYGGGYDSGYGPGPHGYGTTVPYVNGHPIAGW